MNDRPWVRIVIVTHNSGRFTQNCVDALARQTDQLFEVVIVDNMSTDGEVERLSLPDKRFSVIFSTDNSGFSGGSNLGLKGAKTPYVMTLNADAFLSPNCLLALRDATESFPEEHMFSPILFKPGAGQVLDGAGDHFSIFGLGWRNGVGRPISEYASILIDTPEVFGATGAAALYRRDVFEKLGGFDERFFCYIEDVDLAFRIRARGGRCRLIPQADGVHIGGHSSNEIPGFAITQTVRNNLILIVSSAPLILLPIMFVLHLAAHIKFQSKNKRTEIAEIRKRSFSKAIRHLPKILFQRFSRRPYPLGASFRIASSLSWSIRDVKTRPLKLLRDK